MTHGGQPRAAPEFVQVTLDALRRVGPRRIGLAIVEALRKFRPEATAAEMAAWLGVDERLIRKWLAGIDGRWPVGRHATTPGQNRGGRPAGKPDARDRKTGRPGPENRTPGTAKTGRPGPSSHIGETFNRERGRDGTHPPPSLRDQLKTETDANRRLGLLVDGYLARSIHTTPHAEAWATVYDDLYQGRYAAADLAGYLDRTPHVRAWPRELAAAVGAWLNFRNTSAAKARDLAAWLAWRQRLRLVTPGDALWRTDEAHIGWHALGVDAEGGCLVAVRRESSGQRYEQPIRTPAEGAAWTFAAETMPLFKTADPERQATGHRPQA